MVYLRFKTGRSLIPNTARITINPAHISCNPKPFPLSQEIIPGVATLNPPRIPAHLDLDIYQGLLSCVIIWVRTSLIRGQQSIQKAMHSVSFCEISCHLSFFLCVLSYYISRYLCLYSSFF